MRFLFKCSRPLQRTAEEELQDSVFSQAFIPKTLEEVDDHERDFDRLAQGGGAAEGIYYQVGHMQRSGGGPCLCRADAPTRGIAAL